MRLGFVLVILGAIPYPSALPDSSGLLRYEPREWKDETGRVVKRVDASGRMVLLTWDVEGRLVRMGGLAQRVRPGAQDGAVPAGGEAWVHCFLYGPQGLVGEIDCVGERHLFSEPRTLDLKAGTALFSHRHVAAAVLARPTERRAEYDPLGRLTAVKDE